MYTISDFEFRKPDSPRSTNLCLALISIPRWEGFSFNVNRVWLRQQEARAQHEQSTMLTFELWEHWLPKLQRECRIKIWIGKGGENINWLQQMTNTRVNKVSEDGNCWSVKGLDKDCERVVAYARAFQKNGHLPHSV